MVRWVTPGTSDRFIFKRTLLRDLRFEPCLLSSPKKEPFLLNRLVVLVCFCEPLGPDTKWGDASYLLFGKTSENRS